jgi:CofH subfamily radical SAM domain protein
MIPKVGKRKTAHVAEGLPRLMTLKTPNRLTFDEALALFLHEESESLRVRADRERESHAGDRVLWANTLYIYPTNICEACCPMCAFYAPRSSTRAWFFSPHEIEAKIRSERNLSEVHIVGGLNPKCNLAYYLELFSRIRSFNPTLHIKALTAPEIDYIARLESTSTEEVLRVLQKNGLSSMPGGGAEILDDAVRKIIAPKKISSAEWLRIHREAHSLGIPTNATMLFGHIETPEQIINHLLQIRGLQDETRGFRAFVPLKYHPENNALGKQSGLLRPKEIHRIFALSRLVLDNIRDIKVLWNYVGLSTGLDLLDWGGSDFSSTHIGEKVITAAGAEPVQMTEEVLTALLTKKGRVIVRVM